MQTERPLEPRPFLNAVRYADAASADCFRGLIPILLVLGLLLIHSAFAYGQSASLGYDPSGNLAIATSLVAGAPQILAQPRSQTVPSGATTSFTVVPTDPTGITYQWRFNGTNLAGATTDTLLLVGVDATHAGEYSVVLSNSFDRVTSSNAVLQIDTDHDALPDPWELAHFSNLYQNSTGDHDGDGVSNLDEYLDGTNPADPASALYRLTVMSDGASVLVSPSKPRYTNGEPVTLTATAVAPYAFRGWTGDTNTLANPMMLVMNTNKSVFALAGAYPIVWTNTANGNWNTAANWDPNRVPMSGDTVSILSNVTVTISSDVDCGSLTLGSAGKTTLLGSGKLTVYGAFTWDGGVLMDGHTVIAPGGFASIANRTAVTLTRHTLEIGGSAVCARSNIVMSSGIITNRAGALFVLQNTASFAFGGGGDRFDNAGTLQVSSSSATITGGYISLNNYGLVEVLSGTLQLFGGLNSGTMDFGEGTTLNLSGGTFVNSGAGVISGPADLVVSGATATLGGTVNLTGNHTFSLGTATMNGNYICTNNLLTISGGTANFSGTGPVTPATLNLTAGTLGGISTVTPLNQVAWSGGSMSGSGRTLIPPGAALAINNPAQVNLTTGRVLENNGTVAWSGTTLGMSTATIVNQPGALFEIQNGGNIPSGGGVNHLENAGTLRKSYSGTNALLAILNNSGLVEVQNGTLQLAGGTNTATMSFAPGTTLNLSSGTFVNGSGGEISGQANLVVSGATANLGGLVNLSGNHTFSLGTANLNGSYFCSNNVLTISGGTANFNGTAPVTPTTLNLTSGILGGSGTVSPLNQMTWSGGNMSGSGRTLIPPGATLTINNSGSVTLTTRTLEVGGTATWTGNDVVMSTSVITNRPGAVFEIRNSSALAFGGGVRRFDNAGALRKISGATNAFSTALYNYGLLDLKTGTIAANGGFTPSASSTLNCVLSGSSPGTGYGRLLASGTVALNGTLAVELANGYLPTTNDTFTVLTAGTRSGSFANFLYPSADVTLSLSNTATSVIVGVNAVLAVPRPTLLPPEIVDSNFRLTWTAVSNRTYQLEFSPSLNVSNWTVLPGDVIATNNTASKFDPLTPSKRFYRVKVLP